MSDPRNRIVHLVDLDETTRRSTQFLLEALGYEVSSHSALTEISHLDHRGCLLLDVPEQAGRASADIPHFADLALPTVLLSGSGRLATAVEGLRSGAVDFIEKPFRKEALIDAIEAALSVSTAGLAGPEEEDARARIDRLTPRERDVLCGLAGGRSNKMIACELGISPRTIEIHRARMMTRLKAASLSEALRLAFAAGLGDEPSSGKIPAARESV